MVNMKESKLLFNLSNNNNHSTLLNNTESRNWIYVFAPAGFKAKLVLVLLFLKVGIVGFVGNLLIYYFVSQKKKTVPYLKKNPFVRNLNLYVKSLALSDVFSNFISLPLICAQILFDIFQQGWGCRFARYVGLLFPSITINNLMVISTERFFSTRKVPRTLSVYTVRKLVCGAWVAGFVVVVVPAAVMDGIRYNVNDTHYTVACKYDVNYLPFRVVGVSYAVFQHLIPSIILSCINISIAITIWTRQRRTVNVFNDNAIKVKLRVAKMRGTYLLIAITFAFIIPYSASLYYAVYVILTEPNIDFRTDYITRYASAVLIYSNGITNFIIYMIQMKDFRAFVKKWFCGKLNALNPNPVTWQGNLYMPTESANNPHPPH